GAGEASNPKAGPTPSPKLQILSLYVRRLEDSPPYTPRTGRAGCPQRAATCCCFMVGDNPPVHLTFGVWNFFGARDLDIESSLLGMAFFEFGFPALVCPVDGQQKQRMFSFLDA